VVVCGVSSSADAEGVLCRALELTAACGADLVLAHVAQSTNPAQKPLPLPFDPATYRSGALERGAAVLDQIGHEALRRGARGRVELGSWPSRLLAVAAAERADLLVLGRPHRSTLGSRGIARLVRRSPCPIVFV
jgi:nucleotide-binding universal stress UspA family protein